MPSTSTVVTPAGPDLLDGLHFQVIPWHRRHTLKQSNFDLRLRELWALALESGFFLHKVETEPSRIPGVRGFVAALCKNRASHKRKAQSFTKIKQELDPRCFNFTKVKKGEILFQIATDSIEIAELDNSQPATSSYASNDLKDFTSCEADAEVGRVCTTSVIINNSPYEYGHSLLVPEMQGLMMQSMTLDAIKMGIEVLLRSAHPGFRIMYNSLCGGASVNHLHMHCYYTEYWLHSEAFRMMPLLSKVSHEQNDDKGSDALLDCFELDFRDSCVRGFGFVVTKQNYATVLPLKIFRIVQYFNEKNIPHNIVLIRGIPPVQKYADHAASFEAISEDNGYFGMLNQDPNIPFISNDNPHYLDSISIDSLLKNASLVGRAYIFPRVPLYGEKCYRKFLVNVTELFGHLHFGDVEVFNSMTENDVVQALNSVSLAEDEFAKIKSDVIKMLCTH